MFTQVNRTLDRSQGGLGIGLALVKRLVELHGGTITAESPGLGQGSTFTVRLPLVEACRGRTEPRSTAETPSVQPPMSGRRVLVVDDNVDGAESLANCFKSVGHEIRTAHSGPEALDAARPFNPEVVFLDIGLPGMNGYEVAKRLRERAVAQRGRARRPHRLGERGRQAAVEGGRVRLPPDEACGSHSHRTYPCTSCGGQEVKEEKGKSLISTNGALGDAVR